MRLARYDFTFKAMACENELSLYADGQQTAQAIADEAIAAVHILEQKYSRYLDDSVLSSINRASGSPEGVVVDPETQTLLDYSHSCYEQSDGLFDITSGVLRRIWDFKSGVLPSMQQVTNTLHLIGWHKVQWQAPKIVLPIAGMEIDMGGVVKEYAADTCANRCRKSGIKHGLVNMGGDISVIGPHPDGNPWSIGIQNPSDPETAATYVNLSYGALASSGDYQRYMMIDGQRYSHILNPITGWPVKGLRAVSVIAPHCLIAGSTSTIAMLKGDSGKDWLDEVGLPYVCFDDNGACIEGPGK